MRQPDNGVGKCRATVRKTLTMIGLMCKADEFAAKMLTVIAGIRSEGLSRLRELLRS
jgi:hypothetical protein